MGFKGRLTHARRLITYLATVAVAAALAAVATPTAAHAGAIVPCPGDIQYWYRWQSAGRLGWYYEGHRYRVTSYTPRFLASDGRAVTNGLPYPITATVTANQTQTFQVTTTVGVAADLTKELTLNVSVAIIQIRSTMIGVSTSFEVPANRTVFAYYGVHGYDVSYYVEKWHRLNSSPSCEEWGYYPSTATAPTYIEGWNIQLA